jgi:Tfp pilus assembly protein PilF
MLNVFNSKLIFLAILISLVLLTVAAEAQDSLETYLYRGGRALMSKNYTRAQESYEQALRLDPNNLEAIKNLGVICSANGQQENAKEYFDRAYKLDPTEPEVNNNLGVYYSEKGKSEEAIKYFEVASKLNPEKAVYLANLGREYSRVGRISKALPALRHSLQLDPHQPATLFSLGTCHASVNNLDSAEHYFQLSIAGGGANGQVYYFLATIKKKLGKWEDAERNYLEALQLEPNNIQWLHALGMLYLSEQNYAGSAEQARRTIDTDSAFFPGWILLGASYALNNQNAQADTIMRFLFAVDTSLGNQMVEVISTEHKKRKSQQR